MFRGVLGAVLLLGAAPVCAETYFATVRGVVTSTMDTGFMTPGATSPIKVGDTITATFSYMTGDSAGTALGRSFGKVGVPLVTFKVGGFTWSEAGDFGTGFEPLSFDAGSDPLKGFYSTMDDAPGGGDLHVDGYAFEIGEFGYDLYTGPGFKGTFDPTTTVAYRDFVRLAAPAAEATPTALTSPTPVVELATMAEAAPLAETTPLAPLATVVRARRAVDLGSFDVVNTAPAPEPATWAMMIAGFGLAGGALRSRRRDPLPA